VPDVREELAGLRGSRERARRAVEAYLQREQHGLDNLRARPALKAPHAALDARALEVRDSVERARRAMTNRLDRAADELGHTRSRVLALSPAATLTRGYAILQRPTGAVVRDPDEVPAGELLHAHVAGGVFDVRRDA
jgi:exodeoxyribonuclease VII large subunit